MFKKKPGIITVTLNARLQPMHRADLEDAFIEACDARRINAEVVGGGTLLAKNGEVAACDIEVQMGNLDADAIAITGRLFEAMLAPKGSYMVVDGSSERIAIGQHEGLGLYLNGTDLPDDVYQTCDSNHVYEECERRLEGIGMVNSHWQGPNETALYMYGDSFERMHAAILPLLETYPLCRQCRVERIA
ncbi:MAG: hypothetical protein ACN6O2_01585 [Stenotrophomonas sp.]|uniref:hypothetical protein n=1 Tax=Stenotrophomonas sp. TaxID=69392 RepID=UPI0028A7C0DB|nr:hypothetical protein [Stenotrophomonas sp.]